MILTVAVGVYPKPLSMLMSGTIQNLVNLMAR